MPPLALTLAEAGMYLIWVMPPATNHSNGSANTPTEKLSSIVRSVSQNQNNEARGHHQRQDSNSARNTAVPWDPQTGQERPSSRGSNHRNRDSTQPVDPRQRERDREREAREIQRDRVERYGSQGRAHHRNESRETGGPVSSGEYKSEYNESHNNTGRRHDYDVQSMETALSSPRASITKNPIPPPTVTVRSEYPTLTRSRQQQSLTCLVTIEVPEGKWRPDPADLRGAPILPPMQQDSNTFNNSRRPQSPAKSQQADWQSESPEVLEEITEDLRVRVDNWHGLDFQRYVSLRLKLPDIGSDILQIRKATTLRHSASWQGPPIMAGARMLPLCRNAYLREREEGSSSTICGWQLKAETHKMHAQRIDPNQEALEACGVKSR